MKFLMSVMVSGLCLLGCGSQPLESVITKTTFSVTPSPSPSSAPPNDSIIVGPADLYFYLHCASLDQSIVADVVGSAGYVGLDGDALLTVESSGNMCANTWTAVKVHSVSGGGVLVNLVSSGMTVLTTDSLYPEGPPSPETDGATWLGSDGSSRGVLLACSIQSGYRTTDVCSTGMSVTVSCPSWKICVDPPIWNESK